MPCLCYALQYHTVLYTYCKLEPSVWKLQHVNIVECNPAPALCALCSRSGCRLSHQASSKLGRYSTAFRTTRSYTLEAHAQTRTGQHFDRPAHSSCHTQLNERTHESNTLGDTRVQSMSSPPFLAGAYAYLRPFPSQIWRLS